MKPRSSGAPIRCGSPVVALLFLLVLSGFGDRSHAEAAGAADPVQVEPSPYPIPPSVSGHRRLTIFISRSLADAELQKLFRRTGGYADVHFVLRGVKPGERINEAIRDVHRLLREIDPPPAVSIDPLAFRAAAVTSVPDMILEEDGKPLARVRGSTAIDWFLAQVAAGARGDLGIRGPVEAIAEVDLLDEIQRRLGALDGRQVLEGARRRYWRQVRWVELPAATEPRTRTLDPTFMAPQDLQAPDGRFIARAGERFNPLEQLPFTSALVVFDATDAKQLDAARRLAAEAGTARVIFITTRLDREAGWEGLDRLEDRLGERIFLLTNEVRDRFQLERAPALVRAEGNRFVIREAPP